MKDSHGTYDGRKPEPPYTDMSKALTEWRALAVEQEETIKRQREEIAGANERANLERAARDENVIGWSKRAKEQRDQIAKLREALDALMGMIEAGMLINHPQTCDERFLQHEQIFEKALAALKDSNGH